MQRRRRATLSGQAQRAGVCIDPPKAAGELARAYQLCAAAKAALSVALGRITASVFTGSAR